MNNEYKKVCTFNYFKFQLATVKMGTLNKIASLTEISLTNTTTLLFLKSAIGILYIESSKFFWWLTSATTCQTTSM